MKTIFLSVALLVLALIGKAQTPIDEGWVEIGNAAYNSEIYDVSFTNANNGFAVGSGGTFLKTTDGGTTWNAMYIGVKYSLYEIAFSSSNVGYIRGGHKDGGGYFGKILKTTDGGATWVEVLYNPSTYFETMSVRSDSVVFVGDYEATQHTVNGGASWITTSLTGFYTIIKLGFNDAGSGFMIPSDGDFYMSDDLGLSWDSVFRFIGDGPLDFSFPDPVNGFLLSYNGKLALSHDSGLTWSLYKIFTEPMKDLEFFDDSTGFFLDYYGNKIFKTDDTGSTLQLSYINMEANLNGLHKMSDGSLLATGPGGLIIRTEDGISWDTLHIGEMNTNLSDVVFINDQTGFASGTNGYIRQTTDGGVTWATSQINSGVDLGGICVATTDRIIAAGSDSSCFVSTDTCQTWTQFNYGIDMGVARGIERASATQLFAYGTEGMFISNDAGLTWAESGSYSQVYSGFALNSDSVFFGFSNAGIRYTFDGGVSYTDMITVNPAIQGIHFFDADTGLFVNSWGRIYMTNDRGLNWGQMLNCGVSLQELYFVNDTLGYAMGNMGKLYRTTDQGQNWQLIESGTYRALYKMWFTPDGTGYIVGDDGIILRKAATPVFDISFVVTNDSGDTLTNAAMNFNSVSYPAGISEVYGLNNGTYNYIISCPGHMSDTGSVDVVSDTTIVIELKKFHTVTFQLKNVFNNPVSAAGVLFNGDSLVSNSAGDAVFGNVLKSPSLPVQVNESHYLPFSSATGIANDTTISILLQADIAAPVPNTVTVIDDYSFTASWTAGTNATQYALFVSDDNFASTLPGYDSVTVSSLNYPVTGLTAGQTYYFRLRSLNSYGYSAYSSVGTAETTTGIKEISDCLIEVFPNPANSYIVVNSHGVMFPQRVDIFSVCGQQVMSHEINGVETIDISALQPGVYYLRIMDYVQQIIKQ
ncbi:MAG: YCF48-related protein [Bacteroidales bacterium]